jgi:serine protease AprX
MSNRIPDHPVHDRPARIRRRSFLIALALFGVVASSGTVPSFATTAAPTAEVSAGLYGNALQSPAASFSVVIQAADGVSTSTLVGSINNEFTLDPAPDSVIRRRYSVINGVAAAVSGTQLVALASSPSVGSIFSDATVIPSAAAGGYSNTQLWPDTVGSADVWSSGGNTPAIAVVDSGVDATRPDLAGRVVKQVGFGKGSNSGDGYGHGTFVASLATGAAASYAGVAPRSPIISLDVLGADGSGRLRDVVAAADWIYKNAAAYNIRVANFSLTDSATTSFTDDPLDAAVERLWMSGIVVVAAGGNYAVDGQESGVLHSPGNDPFVITVGAGDLNGTADPGDDFAAPWSAWGYTPDGFLKPDVCAPGRVMTAAVPTSSTMYTQHPDRIVAPGYMWMSGTSFAAPVVSGLAAYLLSQHPGWTPGQVKGALMVSAQPGADPSSTACGVGEVSTAASSVSAPPDPDSALYPFVHADRAAGGTPAFDAASWSSAAQANSAWDAASWSSASWSSASWSSASWSSASWSSASWSSASWSSGTSPDGTLPTSTDSTWLR